MTAPESPNDLVMPSGARPANGKTINDDEAMEHSLTSQPVALLLDLSGDKSAASDWAARRLPDMKIRALNKADLKWGSKREALARIKSLAPDAFAIFTSDLEQQSARSALVLFAALAGARRIILGDRDDRLLERSRMGALVFESLRFGFEVLAGYLFIVPVSWLLTLLLSASLRFREITRASKTGRVKISDVKPLLTALYIRATMTAAAEGGMSTHVAGFAGGARALGHRLKLLASGNPNRIVMSGDSQGKDEDAPFLIKPSAALSATKAIFEVLNNLTFTAKSLRLIKSEAVSPDEIDFIYQRYSRFNWTGVATSIVTGLPLALEFNGSEVWVSKRWDPIGNLWLLKRFEQLNQQAADFIFVVSEVERRNLIAAGVAPEKIIVNPNGVDTEKFRPGKGGDEVRRSLGVEDKTVIGFLGTFGPWHGAPVLAEAAMKVNAEARCHFLFIGDGDQRAMTESIIEKTGRRDLATFAGRIPHDRVPAYLDACDILASPHVESADGSEFFGSPTKLFEYMAMARPVIASRLGQIADCISDGENGLLVEPGDAHALACAIELLAKDGAMRERLGAAARRTVIEGYTWKHNAARVFDAVRSDA